MILGIADFYRMRMFSSEASSEPEFQYSEHTQAENPGFRLPQIGDIFDRIRVSFRGDSEHNRLLEYDALQTASYTPTIQR
jgi:hypothetical protein